MSRTLRVIQMQLVNRQTYIWLPLVILAGSWAITTAIHATLRTAGVTTEMYGGGAQAPLWYFLVVGIYALTLTFPFSQAMSVTRRDFYLGTLLTAFLAAVLMSTVFVLCGFLERITNGFGLRAYFFALPWVWEAGPLVAGLVFFVIAMFFFVMGFWAATIYKRFTSLGLTIALIGLGLLLVAAMWLIGRLDAWNDVFAWIGVQGPLGISLWGLVVVAALAASVFPMFRRLVP